MLNQLDNYFFSLEEPNKSCLLFLRAFILNYSEKLEERWKFNTPFYYYKKKWFCYISYHKKTKCIYIGIIVGHKITHSKLVSEGRKQIKVFYVDPEKDIDIKSLNAIFQKATKMY